MQIKGGNNKRVNIRQVNWIEHINSIQAPKHLNSFPINISCSSLVSKAHQVSIQGYKITVIGSGKFRFFTSFNMNFSQCKAHGHNLIHQEVHIFLRTKSTVNNIKYQFLLLNPPKHAQYLSQSPYVH